MIRYALIDDGIVTNLIVLGPRAVKDFPNAVVMDDRPVMIGDHYQDGRFYRDGEEVITEADALYQANQILMGVTE